MRNFCLAAVLLSAPSLAAATTCLQEQYAEFTQASITWFRDLNQILVNTHPDMAETANRYLKLQSITAQEMQIAVYYLLENAPDKVNIDKPLNQWIDFTPELKVSLIQHDTEFARLNGELSELKQGMGSRVDYPLRTAMADLFTQGDATQEAFTRYLEVIEALEQRNCGS